MRTAWILAAAALATSCGKKQVNATEGRAPEIAADGAAAPGGPKTADAERAADEGAYRFIYLPDRDRLAAESPGGWIAIAGARVYPASGLRIEPATSMESADAAARAAAPDAKHRYVFQIGEDGDVRWQLGGCELPRVLGTKTFALLERPDVKVRLSPSDPSVQVQIGDTLTELVVKTGDSRMFVKPEVGPPGAQGAATATYCMSTGFAGYATMSAADAVGLERWEIPGVAHVEGALQSGDCRRARARLRWPNTPLDFNVPVAIWPR